jgi:hypothetical protein
LIASFIDDPFPAAGRPASSGGRFHRIRSLRESAPVRELTFKLCGRKAAGAAVGNECPTAEMGRVSATRRT